MKLWIIRTILVFSVLLGIRTSLAQTGGQSDKEAVYEFQEASQPALGETVTDPVFGTSIRRVTDRGAGGGYGTHIYSQLQAFSADNTYVLLIEDELYTVRRLDDLENMTVDSSSWNAPRWHPTRPNTIVHFDSNDDTTARVQYTDVVSGETETVFTFPAEYEYIRGNQSFDELSRDGQWLAGMLTDNTGASVMFSLNLETASLGAILPVAGLYDADCEPDPDWGIIEPDWIGVSPLGNYMMVQWVRDGIERCSGLESFDITTGEFVGRAYDGHQHGDLGVDENGQEFFMTTELSSPEDPNLPAIGYRPLPGTATVSESQFLLTMDWADDGHISCQGPTGVCLVTNGGWLNNGWVPFERELFLLYTNGDVVRLAHHHSTSCGYWVQPRASISADGRYVIFASDWLYEDDHFTCAGNSLGQGDAYVIDLEG